MSTIKIEKDYIRFEVVLKGILNINPFEFRRAKIINIVEPGISLKGVVINISNDNLSSPCMEDGNDELTFRFIIKNDLGWKKDDNVRVSFLNEVDYRDFEKLIPYFEARLRRFDYDPSITGENFLDYSKEWSKFNTNNPVDDKCEYLLSPIPRQTHDGGVVRIEELP